MLTLSKADPDAVLHALAILKSPDLWQHCTKKDSGKVLLCQKVSECMQVQDDSVYTGVSSGVVVVGEDGTNPRVVSDSEFSAGYTVIASRTATPTIYTDPIIEGSAVTIEGGFAYNGTVVSVYINGDLEETFIAVEGDNLLEGTWELEIASLAEHDIITCTHLNPVPGEVVSESSANAVVIGADA
jgi:hypothetical protein